MENNLVKLTKKIAKKNKFKIGRKIYQAYSQILKGFRNVIYSGKLSGGKEAVLKVYDDYRINDEPLSLKFYNKINKSRLLLAPRLYKYGILSAKSGWLIMEKLPQHAFCFKSPLNKEERKKFLELFLTYRRILPFRTAKRLNLVEDLPASQFHIYRLNKWLKLANDKEAMQGYKILEVKEIIPRFFKTVKLMEKAFAREPMIFCHGHFKPKEIAKVGDKYYLTDFGHFKSYPLGYELAFMVWADWLIPANWKLSYRKWRKGVFSWLKDLKPIARELKIKDFTPLIKASIIERIMGTILADVCSTDKSKREKIMRVNLLYKLFDELI
jgi:hypothetical protein